MKKAFLLFVGALSLSLGVLTTTSVSAAEKAPKVTLTDKPSLGEKKIETARDFEKMARELAAAYYAPGEPMPVAMVETDMAMQNMIDNKIECIIVGRTDAIRTGEKWAFVKQSLQGPEVTVIGYTMVSGEKQPIYVLVDRMKKDDWASFVRFCKTSDKAQAIIAKHNFVPLAHKDRV